MPANKISHNNGMAQLPLAISGKPFTTMKKALFHGRLRVFGEKMRMPLPKQEPSLRAVSSVIPHSSENAARIDWEQCK